MELLARTPPTAPHKPIAPASLQRAGYALVDEPGSARSRDRVFRTFDRLLAESGGASCRIAANHDIVRQLLHHPGIAGIVRDRVGPGARPVRAIAFDKTAGRNWAVPWHQDRTIAVGCHDERADVRCWTVKNGVPHCEPPVGLLERMVTLRWHLDAVGPHDGCIRVLPGSHRLGRRTAADISRLLAEMPAVDVPVPAGAVFVMSPLLVHSSRKRVTEGRRRVLHVELAAGDPPAPLSWVWA